jgi:hypothetical protein
MLFCLRSALRFEKQTTKKNTPKNTKKPQCVLPKKAAVLSIPLGDALFPLPAIQTVLVHHTGGQT